MRPARAPSPRSPGARGAARRALLAALAGIALAALALALAEGALRLAGFGGDPGDLFFTRLGDRAIEPGMFTPHRERFFALRAGYRCSPEHAGANAIDAWPFRGRPLDPAPPDAWKVAVFGDSCAYGLPLPANASLPACLDRELYARLGDARALVANLGVPGYTTVQIRALVEETLARFELDQVVLYPAAWNDQAPSVGRNDLELRADIAGPLAGLALASGLRALAGRAPPAWPADRPPPDLGPRVPPDAVEPEVRATIQACLDRGVGVVVIVPPHPERYRASHARMFRDADAVRRAARALGVALIDEQERLGAPADEDRYFADLVHPAPEGCRALAERVADVLVARAPAARAWAREPATHMVAAVRPETVPELGDVAVEVELGPGVATDRVAVTIGGAALLAPRIDGGVVRGRVPRLAPGAVDVVVQTAAAIARVPGAVTVEPPRLEVLADDAGDAGDPGGARRVRLTSRPGDHAHVAVATALREHALVTSRGAMVVDDGAFLDVRIALACDDAGRGEARLPELPGDGPYHLQALVAPRSEEQGSAFATWSTTATVGR